MIECHLSVLAHREETEETCNRSDLSEVLQESSEEEKKDVGI